MKTILHLIEFFKDQILWYYYKTTDFEESKLTDIEDFEDYQRKNK